MYLNLYIPMVGNFANILPPAINVYDILDAAVPANADPHRRRIHLWIFQALDCIRKRAAAGHQTGQIVYERRV